MKIKSIKLQNFKKFSDLTLGNFVGHSEASCIVRAERMWANPH